MPFAAAQKPAESPVAERSASIAFPGAWRSQVWLFVVVAATFAYLYTSVFGIASGIPHLRSGDEGFFWTYGARLLSGQVFLRDFHQFTPPGTDLVYAGVFRVFGANLRAIDWTIVSLGMALAMGCFFCARRILRANIAALAALACVVVLYGDRMDATHHWFSSLANLVAVLLFSRGSSRMRIAGGAVLIAIAALFTQTAGVVGLLACGAGLVWEKRSGLITSRMLGRRMVGLLCLTGGVWLLLSLCFIVQAGAARYWFEQVTSLSRDSNFPEGFLVPDFRASLHVRSLIGLGDHLLVYVLLLTVCPWVARLCWRQRIDACESAPALVLLSALGILQTLEVIMVLNWNRMAAVAIPSVILGVWQLTHVGASGRRWAMVSACVVGGMMVVQSGATQVRHFSAVKLPGGNALLEKDDVDELAWLVARTRPGDCFLEVGNTRIYVPLALRNPTPVDVLAASNFTLPQWVDESVQGLKQCATRYLLWEPRTGVGRVEEMHRTGRDHLDPLRAYVHEQYVRVAVFANGDEVWERRY